jgi:hypothetical protein
LEADQVRAWLAERSKDRERSYAEFAAQVRERLHVERSLPSVNNQLRITFVDSSFVLDAARANSIELATQACASRLWMAALAARSRATGSRWPADVVDFCDRILSSQEPQHVAHTIAPGDTLTRIVRKRLGVPLAHVEDVVRRLNPRLADLNNIRAGTTLRLPVL